MGLFYKGSENIAGAAGNGTEESEILLNDD